MAIWPGCDIYQALSSSWTSLQYTTTPRTASQRSERYHAIGFCQALPQWRSYLWASVFASQDMEQWIISLADDTTYISAKYKTIVAWIYKYKFFYDVSSGTWLYARAYQEFREGAWNSRRPLLPPAYQLPFWSRDYWKQTLQPRVQNLPSYYSIPHARQNWRKILFKKLYRDLLVATAVQRLQHAKADQICIHYSHSLSAWTSRNTSLSLVSSLCSINYQPLALQGVLTLLICSLARND